MHLPCAFELYRYAEPLPSELLLLDSELELLLDSELLDIELLLEFELLDMELPLELELLLDAELFELLLELI